MIEPVHISEGNYLTTVSNLPAPAEKNISSKTAAPSQKEIATASSAFNNINYYLFDVTSRLKSILNAQPLNSRSGGVAFFQLRENNAAHNNFDIDFKVGPERTELFPQALEQLSKIQAGSIFAFMLHLLLVIVILTNRNKIRSRKLIPFHSNQIIRLNLRRQYIKVLQLVMKPVLD